MLSFALGKKGTAWEKYVVPSFVTILAAGSLLLCYKLMHRGIDEVAREFEALDKSSYERIFVSYDVQPDVKYQYEFGRLRDEAATDGYPEKFVFQVKQTTGIDGSFDNHLFEPVDADCDLYFHIPPQEGFVCEEGCRYSFRKEMSD